jgi:hypothetical protein
MASNQVVNAYEFETRAVWLTYFSRFLPSKDRVSSNNVVSVFFNEAFLFLASSLRRSFQNLVVQVFQ